MRTRQKSLVPIILLTAVFMLIITFLPTTVLAANNTYNDVFASTVGSGHNLSQAKSTASNTYARGDYVYVWGYLHDGKGHLFKTYDSGTCNQTISIYKPDGTCAHTYTYNNSDCNWIGTRLDVAGTWKIQCKITGKLSGTNTQSITVRNIYNDVFASSKGSGYNLEQAKASSSSSFTVGDKIYAWGYIHDGNGHLYKSFGHKTLNMTLSVFKPDGTCAHNYTYNNSDSNWIGITADAAGTWKIQSKITGDLSATNTQTITVKEKTQTVSTKPVRDVTLDYSSITLNTKGAVKQLTAIITPSDATNKTVTWSSSNSGVATVSSNGLVTAVANGIAVISARTSNGISGTVTVNVVIPEKERTTYNDVFASTVGRGYNLTQAKSAAKNKFFTGDYVYVWGYLHDGNGHLYKSYGSGTCNQIISIYKPNGTCAFTYTYNNSDSNWIGTSLDTAGTWKIQCKITGSLTGTKTQTITVEQKKQKTSMVAVTDIILNTKSVAINTKGGKKQLTAAIKPANATNKVVTWTSSNSKVATVSSSGCVTAVANGIVTITAKTSNGKTAKATVKVNISSGSNNKKSSSNSSTTKGKIKCSSVKTSDAGLKLLIAMERPIGKKYCKYDKKGRLIAIRNADIGDGGITVGYGSYFPYKKGTKQIPKSTVIKYKKKYGINIANLKEYVPVEICEKLFREEISGKESMVRKYLYDHKYKYVKQCVFDAMVIQAYNGYYASIMNAYANDSISESKALQIALSKYRTFKNWKKYKNGWTNRLKVTSAVAKRGIYKKNY